MSGGVPAVPFMPLWHGQGAHLYLHFYHITCLHLSLFIDVDIPVPYLNMCGTVHLCWFSVFVSNKIFNYISFTTNIELGVYYCLANSDPPKVTNQ